MPSKVERYNPNFWAGIEDEPDFPYCPKCGWAMELIRSTGRVRVCLWRCVIAKCRTCLPFTFDTDATLRS